MFFPIPCSPMLKGSEPPFIGPARPFAISLFFFTAFHCRLLWKNRTTIETGSLFPCFHFFPNSGQGFHFFRSIKLTLASQNLLQTICIDCFWFPNKMKQPNLAISEKSGFWINIKIHATTLIFFLLQIVSFFLFVYIRAYKHIPTLIFSFDYLRYWVSAVVFFIYYFLFVERSCIFWLLQCQLQATATRPAGIVVRKGSDVPRVVGPRPRQELRAGLRRAPSAAPPPSEGSVLGFRPNHGSVGGPARLHGYAVYTIAFSSKPKFNPTPGQLETYIPVQHTIETYNTVNRISTTWRWTAANVVVHFFLLTYLALWVEKWILE